MAVQLRDLEMEKRNARTVVAVILGGGAGTRLFPLTKQRAKPAVCSWCPYERREGSVLPSTLHLRVCISESCRSPLEGRTGWSMSRWATASTAGSTKCTFSLSSIRRLSTAISPVPTTSAAVSPSETATLRHVGTAHFRLSQLLVWSIHNGNTWTASFTVLKGFGCYTNSRRNW